MPKLGKLASKQRELELSLVKGDIEDIIKKAGITKPEPVRVYLPDSNGDKPKADTPYIVINGVRLYLARVDYPKPPEFIKDPVLGQVHPITYRPLNGHKEKNYSRKR